MSFKRALQCGLVALTFWAGAAVFAATPEAVADASQRLAEAGRALEVAQGHADQTQALGSAIAAYEQALAAVRSVVISAGAMERQISVELASEQAGLSRMLAALQAVSRQPAPALMMHPLGPVAAARAGGMMAKMTPVLKARAAELSARLGELTQARQLQAQGISDLDKGLTQLREAHVALKAGLGAGEETTGRIDAATAAALVDSETLSGFSAAMAVLPGRPVATGQSGAGQFKWPVEGRISRRFNGTDAAGVRHPGLTLSAPPLSLVVAPADAMVRYAGPFLDYQNVIILETDGGRMIVLAGIAQINTRSGEPVARGEPLGMLGGRSPNVDEYVMLQDAETGAGLRESLYIEIRDGRGPVDPVSWFEGENG